MTSNQIAYKDANTREGTLKETKRSNRAKEGLETSKQETERRGQNLKFATDLLGNVIKGAKVAGNDPEWYRAEPALVKDVASISFNNPLGNGFDTMFKAITQSPSVIPGVITITWVPTVGEMEKNGQSSTADIAAKSLYSYVRYANSGSRNYESVDLMMYLLGVGECYSYYAYLCKVYSLVTTCKSDNRYYVDAMANVHGVNVDDIRSNLANFRAYINTFAVRLNSLYIPKDLPLFKRHMWMNSSIFKDAPIKKSQEYVFLQKNFLAYDDKAGKLTVFPSDIQPTSYSNYAYNFRPGANFTFNQLKATGDMLINSLVNSEDAGIMGGDILKAYGPENMAKASLISDDFHIESIYSAEVLSQIENTILVGEPGTGFTDEQRLFMYDIGQTSINMVDYITQGLPYYATSQDAISKTNVVGYGFPSTLGLSQQSYTTYKMDTEHSIINFHHDDPTPDDVMVATRLQAVMEKDIYFSIGKADSAGSINTGAITSCGTEIALSIYTTLIDPTTQAISSFGPYAMVLDMSVADRTFVLNMVLQFDWHPRMYFTGSDGSNAGNGISDMGNYTTLSNQSKRNMHYVAVLSELGIPKLGLTVRGR